MHPNSVLQPKASPSSPQTRPRRRTRCFLPTRCTRTRRRHVSDEPSIRRRCWCRSDPSNRGAHPSRFRRARVVGCARESLGSEAVMVTDIVTEPTVAIESDIDASPRSSPRSAGCTRPRAQKRRGITIDTVQLSLPGVHRSARTCRSIRRIGLVARAVGLQSQAASPSTQRQSSTVRKSNLPRPVSARATSNAFGDATSARNHRQ